MHTHTHAHASTPPPPPPPPTHTHMHQALTGGAIEVPTLDGRTIRVPINEIVSPGYCKRVVGEGMPLAIEPPSPATRGDLLVQFKVDFPQTLSPERKALLKQALL